MEIKYIKKSITKIILGLFIISMITFGATFALIWFKDIFSYAISLVIAIAIFVVIIILSKKERICRKVEIGEIGLVDQIGTLKFHDIKKVVYGSDKIKMDFGFANIETKYQEALNEKLQNLGIKVIKHNGRLINYERMFMIAIYCLGIYFFYNLFILIFGTIYCSNNNFEIIDSFGMLNRVFKLISVLLALYVYYEMKNKKIAVAISIIIVGSFIIWSNFVKIDKYHDYHGNFACIMKKSNLNIYKDVVLEYGVLAKKIENLDGYYVKDLTEREKVILYYGPNVSGQYIVYREELGSRVRIFNNYNGKTFTNGILNISFNDNKLAITNVDGEIYEYDDVKLVNGYILEIYKNDVVNDCIIFNDFKNYKSRYLSKIVISQNEGGIFDLDVLEEDIDKKASSNKKDKNNSESKPREKLNNTSDENKNINGENLVKKMDSFNSRSIKTFKSNQDFVKIKNDSNDYNNIVLEVAKQFTIINNTDKKIDTQILQISVLSGNLDEFGVMTYDRQDISGEEKVKNTYFYRIKKIGGYYLAARVSDDCNVNIGLMMLNPEITTDTSMSTDFLYRIEGKKYIGNRWG